MIIGVLNQKGGCGKTTLLVDADPQASAMAYPGRPIDHHDGVVPGDIGQELVQAWRGHADDREEGVALSGRYGDRPGRSWRPGRLQYSGLRPCPAPAGRRGPICSGSFWSVNSQNRNCGFTIIRPWP